MFQRDRVFLVRIDLLSFEDLKKKIGLEVGVSKWFTIDQERIDKFADVTEDWQYIHVDPFAAMNTPFNGAIAHGFLTVSLLLLSGSTNNQPMAGKLQDLSSHKGLSQLIGDLK